MSTQQSIKIKVYKGKGKTYITKSGEVRHYDSVQKYMPRVKKFDPLLYNPEIQAILKDRNKKVSLRVEDIYNIYLKNSELSSLDFTYEQIQKFVYRNAEKVSNL